MSRQICLPINQVRLTNVAVVRYTVQGKRFEIACYRNKVMDYRAGLETDLSEVLQTDRIFTNVSKGRFAATDELKKAFGMIDQEAIAQRILLQGKSLQVSDLERSQMLESTVTQIATWVAHNCVHPATNRPYTVTQIKQALGKNYQVQAHKAMKKQYLDAVKFLKNVIPVERAKMELSLQYAIDKDDQVNEVLKEMEFRMVKDTSDGSKKTIVLQVDPSLFRQLNQLAEDMEGRLEILQQQVVLEQQGDVDLEQDMQQRQQQQKDERPERTSTVDEFDSDDEEAVALAEKLQAVRVQTGSANIDDEEDDSSSDEVPSNTKQQYASPEDVPKEDGSDDDDSDGDDYLQSQASRRKNQRKAQKKKNKKTKRRQQQEQDGEEEDSDDSTTKQNKSTAFTATRTTPAVSTDPNAKHCNTCGGAFANAAEYRAHFRSDWHRFNQKLKLKSIPPVSEEEFLLCDADAFFGSADN